MKKWFLRIMIACSIAFGILLISGFFLKMKWSQDLESLAFKNEKFEFQAKRDAMGVWDVNAQDFASLAFAFGYLHAFDREFQSEVIRRAATGRLASLFGESLIGRDRLFRNFVYPSKDEFENLKKTDPLFVEMLESYVQGRKSALLKGEHSIPVEYRIFVMDRAQSADWEAWELLAISRLNSWQFSSDFQGENLRWQLDKILGLEKGRWLSPGEPASSPALYDQVLAKEWVKSSFSGTNFKKSPSSQEGANGKFLIPLSLNALKKVAHSNVFTPMDQSEAPSFIFSKISAASNSWLLQDPRVARPLTLCNDTHLDFAFPSSLYPMKYTVKSVEGEEFYFRSVGYSLPGVPFHLLGQFEKYKKDKSDYQSRVLGITIADFLDTQDLVQLSPASLENATKVLDTFEIFDPQTQKRSFRELPVVWTAYGPQVDSFIDWAEQIKEPPPLALDWLGFRSFQTPLRFFMRENLGMNEDLPRAVDEFWQYPSVNLSYIQIDKNKKQSAGHLVTGMVFVDESPQARVQRRTFVSESQVDNRKILNVSERPYFEVSKTEDLSFYLASANQRVWSGSLGLSSAYEWTAGNRAETLVEKYHENVLKPESSQTDYFSRDALLFVKESRKLIKADQLCATQRAEFSQACLELLAKLDAWKGNATWDDWEPTVVFLWRMQLRKKIFPFEAVEGKGAQKLFKRWNASNMSDRLILDLVANDKSQKRFNTLFEKNYTELVTEAFGDSLDLLVKDFGPMASEWKWGKVHQIEWGHPVAKIPGPLGVLLRDSLLGPAPAVSGSDESPGATSYRWDSENPTNFPAVHGAVMRFCGEFDVDGHSKIRWANVTGVSGNPFSPWAWKFARETWFAAKLVDANSL